MNFTARMALAVALLLAVPAQAQQGGQQSSGRLGDELPGIVIDTNLFCDTQSQVERFVRLLNDNNGNAEAAINAVNVEEKMVDACVIATAAYRRGEEVAMVRNSDAAMHVVRIELVGVFTIDGFEPALPTPFFTLLPQDEMPGTVGRR